MRFLTRSLLGILLTTLTLGLLAMAAGTLFSALSSRDDDARGGRPPQERVFAVNVALAPPQTVTPTITAYGTVESARTLEIRASAAGLVVELADGFRDGGQVRAGEVLLRVDDADAQAALDLARAELDEAQAKLREAEAGLGLARDDLAAALQQRDLRAQALTRARDLLARGAGTGAGVEAAELSLSAAEQALVGRRQALAQAEAAVDRARISIARQQISLRDAERGLDDTVVTAPFDGVLTAATVVQGGLVGVNEKVGSLLDPSALEVAFRVSNAQYARLLQSDGQLAGVRVRGTLALDGFPVTVTGRLDRTGASVGAGQTGRLLYAGLGGAGAAALRPGDFLTVTIDERPLENVNILPATAVNTAGEILVLGADDRLEEATVEILRRQGDMIFVSGAPPDREIVLERLPQLGAGVRIRPVRAGAGIAAPEMVALAPEVRAQLIAAVEANTRMPEVARNRALEALAKDDVPKDLVDRLAERLGMTVPESGIVAVVPAAADSNDGDSHAGDSVTLEPERRARLIAFVTDNQRMPEDVKARLLAQLNAASVPGDVVARLEQRMGG